MNTPNKAIETVYLVFGSDHMQNWVEAIYSTPEAAEIEAERMTALFPRRENWFKVEPFAVDPTDRVEPAEAVYPGPPHTRP